MAEEQHSYRDSRIDDVTGVFNQEYLMERLAVEFKRARRYAEPLSCLCVDLDRFAALNERHGTEFGDQALRHVASTLRRVVRDVDFVARAGNDEFLVVLPNTPLPGAVVVAEKAVGIIGGAPADSPEGPERLTVSVGAAPYSRLAIRSEAELVEAARATMLQAKAQGGNRVVEVPL
jgi:diguanylate cyclase (GGDEF)-like protein